ncbi:MAG TPA: SHOCT domain-containing protein [Anaerolineales bacterium]|nr:SHOCT domain-containing protein [Anaerolineales bacterium]
MMGMGMGFGVLLFFFFTAVMILGGVWLVKSIFTAGGSVQPPVGGGATPRQILDERYARGEIDRETYETMRRDLEA